MTPPPPPPPAGGPPGYPPGSPWGAAPGYQQVREHPDGTTVLVLGILGLVVCGLLAPFAWAKGNRAMREIDAQPHIQWSNRGSVSAGRICGIIGSVLLIVGVAFFVLIIVAAAATA